MAQWFTILLQPIILIVSLMILVKSSDLVSDSSLKISKITSLGEMVIGFLVLSVVTSLPELAVSLSAVKSGDIALPIGGLFGSNIANIGLILGLMAVLSSESIRASHEEFRGMLLMMTGTSVLPFLGLFLEELSYLVGWSLVAMFVIFSIYSIKRKGGSIKDEDEENSLKMGKRGLLREVGIVIGGVAAVIVSSQFVVESSVNISDLLGLDQSVIGATVIALGTSLPELSVSLAAVKKGSMSLALGNILGSCITNLTLILGIVLSLSTLEINPLIFTDLVVMLFIINLTLWRFIVDNKIGMGGGVALLLLYMLFLASTFGVQIVILSPEYLGYVLNSAINMILQGFPYVLVGATALILGWLLNKG